MNGLKKKIVILGPAHPFRGGGITTFNERMARAFQENGHDVVIYNFTLQYPSFLFPGKSQYSSEKPPTDITILQKLNSINPLNWWQTGRELRLRKPDILIVRFWLPFMGPAFGTVLRQVRKNKHTRIIAITDNVIPHEKRFGDKVFTQYFLAPCHAFITMSKKVMADLKLFAAGKPAIEIAHPLYDNFGEAVSKPAARSRLNINPDYKVLLFFGFIRKYKGLDLLLEAIALLKSEGRLPAGFKLLVAGEFYEDETLYQEKISHLDISDCLIMKTDFIADEEVKYYFCAADGVIQPYRNATQSGVTPLAYHFEKPMIVTRVGALPDYVPDGISGLVCTPDAPGLANAISQYFSTGEAHFLEGLKNEKKKYSWHQLVSSIETLASQINPR